MRGCANPERAPGFQLKVTWFLNPPGSTCSERESRKALPGVARHCWETQRGATRPGNLTGEIIIIIIIKIKFYTAIIYGKILYNLSEASVL